VVCGAVHAPPAHGRPAPLDALASPQEISAPPKPTVQQGWGFAIAKIKENINSRE